MSDQFNINEGKLTLQTISQRNVMIMRGTRSQNNVRYHESRNKQCTPIAVVAMAFNKIRPFSFWTTEEIDNTLDYGDHLYRKSNEIRISQNLENISLHPYLMMQDIHPKLII